MFSVAGVLVLSASMALATPANKAALEKHYDRFLSAELGRCTTCHLPGLIKNPESLDDFPHNPFGTRLRAVGRELAAAGKKKDIPARLKLVAREDTDGDGVDNEMELLLGHNPGNAKDTPTKKELGAVKAKPAEFAKFLASYRWQPFDPVTRPPVPPRENRKSEIANSIDAFIAEEHQARGLKPRPEAAKEILLRRVYLDLIGLSPTTEEQQAFARDPAPDAYEKVVDRLLADPRHGERWGRHWMDVWRYSDWAGWSGGNQIRDSQPHIWRWRDWIVESLNQDKGYDRMILEMLAADELAPADTNAVRATGFLVRNYKMLSREQWLEDTVKHTSQAFLGVTMGCAKCHDHMFDPFTQKEYYQMRAIFEPHQVRTDRVPGEPDVAKNGLVRVYDVGSNPPTYFLHRGDERTPDTNRILSPGVPAALSADQFALKFAPIKLPRAASHPDQQDFLIAESVAASQKSLTQARSNMDKLKAIAATPPEKLQEQELLVAATEAKHAELQSVFRADALSAQKETEEWKAAARDANARQRAVVLAEARLKLFQAQTAQAIAQKKAEADNPPTASGETKTSAAPAKPGKNDPAGKAAKELSAANKKLDEAVKLVAESEKKSQAAPETAYKSSFTNSYPTSSTGRRLAFANWLAGTNNPLTARVAANQIWLRHFGQALVPTPNDFGRNGRPPSHPQLLDWLAAELMNPGSAGILPARSELVGKMPALRDESVQPWSMKHLHRLIVTSSTYRMASTPDEANAKLDPDNTFLWRMNSRRMEAEVVRDNLLFVSGSLDPARGGPDIDHNLGLKSKRRSIYLRQAAEKEVEFLKIFDGPAVTECYIRRPSVVPQQALAMANSELTVNEARSLAKKLSTGTAGDPEAYARRAFECVLARQPKADELKFCREFLEARTKSSSVVRAHEALVMVLFNHNDFLTVR